MRALVDRGAGLDARDKWQRTPLMVAAYEGHTSTVRLLVEAGAGVNPSSNLAPGAGRQSITAPTHRGVEHPREKSNDRPETFLLRKHSMLFERYP